jgi:hypothetical protein
MDIEQSAISYNDFVIGLAKKTLSFEIKDKKAFGILFFDNFIVWLTRILLLLIIVPIIIIPVLSYELSNWWYLFGFLGVFFGNTIHGINTKSSNPIKNLIELTLSFCLPLGLFVYYIGIQNPFVFSFACLVYTFFFMDLSNNVYDEVAKNKLIANEKSFYYAMDNQIIQIIKK